MDLVRLLKQYNTQETTRRCEQNAVDVAMEWIGLLSAGGNVKEKLVLSIMSENPAMSSECVTYYQRKFKRLSAESTTSIQE